MFCIVYEFKVIAGREQDFIRSWEALTRLIYEHAGSLGSRLHRNADNCFVAYAQWPDRFTRDNSDGNLPSKAASLRMTMRECCSSIRTIYELDVMNDLLKNA